MSFDLHSETFGDAILGSVCPTRTENNLRLFVIELHCNVIYVVAELVKEKPLKFDVLYLEATAQKHDAFLLARANAFFNVEIEEQPAVVNPPKRFQRLFLR